MKDTITVYSKNDCIYCDRAKGLLKELNVPFREILVDTNDRGAVSELQTKTGMKTFPQIFIGQQVVGGFTELKELAQKTGLKQFA
jgi:glutaredoxin 3